MSPNKDIHIHFCLLFYIHFKLYPFSFCLSRCTSQNTTAKIFFFLFRDTMDINFSHIFWEFSKHLILLGKFMLVCYLPQLQCHIQINTPRTIFENVNFLLNDWYLDMFFSLFLVEYYIFKTNIVRQYLQPNATAYVVHSICFQTFFFVQVFKIVVDSWKFTILLLYVLWDDWPIFMISDSNQQLQ